MKLLKKLILSLLIVTFTLSPLSPVLNVYNIKAEAASSTTWKKTKKVYDGAGGYYLTHYEWIKGNEIGFGNFVSNAQKKAIKKKYGKISSKYYYKMETKQHIGPVKFQTQGYMTVGATAICHGRK
ncbi:hypothetical protein HB903_12315 [Listeria welshimeri]|uniref:hypothetical protein n=1 Tax=Listeria welshimeri TaxID=1643 RepID=UPI00162680BA|nr:hypothetical protein [Listeria welshimeri]MBC1588036.1 hypothetical protein [Listeria welshimeri]MBC1602728.1 hypothetical protein [Listeria welshimeri]MBC1609337.1 hypothetical protein [Listeria welshimeri]MBC1629496.1 hypothetical protein [Listeria welshimeri]MBC1676518.1 hypothetical protein [Listeria welshimeri]